MSNKTKECFLTDHIIQWAGDGYFCSNCMTRFSPTKDEAEKEIVICSAVKTSGNVVIRGHRHGDCFRAIENIPRLDHIDSTQGFVTSENRFVGRKEAMEIQIKAGKKSASNKGIDLFSEDLY